MFADVPFRRRAAAVGGELDQLGAGRGADPVLRRRRAGAGGAGPAGAFSVPTGNFGNVLAAWAARRMGLPIARLVVAANRNDILAASSTPTTCRCMPTVAPSLSPHGHPGQLQLRAAAVRAARTRPGRDCTRTMLGFAPAAAWRCRTRPGARRRLFAASGWTTRHPGRDRRLHRTHRAISPIRTARSASPPRRAASRGPRPRRADGRDGHRAPGQVPRRDARGPPASGRRCRRGSPTYMTARGALPAGGQRARRRRGGGARGRDEECRLIPLPRPPAEP